MTTMLVEECESILEGAIEKIGCGDSSQDEGDDSNFNSGRESPVSQAVSTTSESPRFPSARQHRDSEAYFRNLLSEQGGLKSFKRFAEGRFNDSNVRFWDLCEQYRKTSPIDFQRLHDLFDVLNERFLRRSAPCRVILSRRTLEEIKNAIRYGSPVGVHLFEKAQEEVFQEMLHKEYPEYLLSLDAVSETETSVSISSQSCYSNLHCPPFPSKPGSTYCDSSSTISIGSDPGVKRPKVLRKPVSSASRSTVSDTETLPMIKARVPKKVASQEEFVALIAERLMAVEEDRLRMKKEVQEMNFNKPSEGEVLDWYDHPAAQIYNKLDTSSASRHNYPASSSTSVSDPRGHSRHTQAQGTLRAPIRTRYEGGYSQLDLDSSMKELNLRSQHKNQTNMRPMSDITDSGIYSDTRERQIGSNGGNNRVLNYVQGQQNLQVSDREREAQHAATILINNTPAVDQSVLPYSFGEWDPASKTSQYSPPGQSSYPRSGDDSTSISSGSHLFVPRRDQSRDPYSDPERSHVRHSKPPKSSALKRQKPASSQTGRKDVLIVYYLDNEQIQYAHKVEDRDITLGEFKDTIFRRQGEYRFFFNEWNEEVNAEVRSEYIYDGLVLPRISNRIEGKIERIVC